MTEKIEKRLKEIDVEFEATKKQLAMAQQQTQELGVKLTMLQGEYQGLDKLLKGDKVVDIKK